MGKNRDRKVSHGLSGIVSQKQHYYRFRIHLRCRLCRHLTDRGRWRDVVRGQDAKVLFVYLAIALLPMILGLAGTGVRWDSNERLLALNEIAPTSQQAAEMRQRMLPEYVITVLIGAGSTSLPLLIGIAGLILKRNPQSKTTA